MKNDKVSPSRNPFTLHISNSILHIRKDIFALGWTTVTRQLPHPDLVKRSV